MTALSLLSSNLKSNHADISGLLRDRALEVKANEPKPDVIWKNNAKNESMSQIASATRPSPLGIPWHVAINTVISSSNDLTVLQFGTQRWS
jgi:hypothetical protein